jgi:hypothetical protein
MNQFIPSKFPMNGIAVLVFTVVDIVLNIPVKPFEAPLRVSSKNVIFPEISKVVHEFVFPIPNLLLKLPRTDFDDCIWMVCHSQ